MINLLKCSEMLWTIVGLGQIQNICFDHANFEMCPGSLCEAIRWPFEDAFSGVNIPKDRRLSVCISVTLGTACLPNF